MNERRDDTCRKCGRCCRLHERIAWYDKTRGPCSSVRFTGEYCPLLDTATMLCTVYATRHAPHAKRPFPCLTVDQAITKRVLPNDCPYVRDVPGYLAEVRA